MANDRDTMHYRMYLLTDRIEMIERQIDLLRYEAAQLNRERDALRRTPTFPSYGAPAPPFLPYHSGPTYDLHLVAGVSAAREKELRSLLGVPSALLAPPVRTGPPVTAMAVTSADDEFTGTLFPQIATRPQKPRAVVGMLGSEPMPAPGTFDPRGHLTPARLSEKERADLCATLGYDPVTGRECEPESA